MTIKELYEKATLDGRENYTIQTLSEIETEEPGVIYYWTPPIEKLEFDDDNKEVYF